MLKRMLRYSLLLLLLAMPRRDGRAQSPPETFAAGPDVILGDLPSLIQAGSNGTQVGLMMATDICNNGDVQVNWFRLPETDHPVIPQNLYRMSGGANNDERFEQIGQSWVKHAFFPLQQNACGFGCTPSPDSAHLGVGCSNPDSASLNASQPGLGSRAWVNPFTGSFPSTSGSHTGHTHDGTTHRILVEGNDLNPTMNQGATYYGEAQLATPHEYDWCQAHLGECNMFNNVSYRQFMVVGTTSFNFSAVGDTVRMTPAIQAWPGATIQTIEPAPGVDGRAFIAYKVTGPFGGIWRYEYAIYNQNLDRGIQSFSVSGAAGSGRRATWSSMPRSIILECPAMELRETRAIATPRGRHRPATRVRAGTQKLLRRTQTRMRCAGVPYITSDSTTPLRPPWRTRRSASSRRERPSSFRSWVLPPNVFRLRARVRQRRQQRHQVQR